MKKEKRSLTEHQKQCLHQIEKGKHQYVIGIDEVGLGSWAGPIMVAGVVFPKGWSHSHIVDSKTIAHAKRERALQEFIYPYSPAYCVLSMTSQQIDRIGIETARQQLTEGCALYCLTRFPEALVVQDGDRPVPVDGRLDHVVCLPKADALVAAVSAASILAKVTHDLFMFEQARYYPDYGFITNVGYRSVTHERGLQRYGLTPIHRRSYKPMQNYNDPLKNW